MQRPHVISGSWCFADGDTKLAAIAVNRGECGTVLNFNQAWPCLFIDIQNTFMPARRSLGEIVSAWMKRLLAIQLVGLVYYTGGK